MLSKIEESGSSGRLLLDIEQLSKALYLQKNPPKYLISPPDYQIESAKPYNYVDKEDLQKGKKSSLSIWKNWKVVKALTHIRSHKLNCRFFLRVHSIKGLPSNFNDLGLYVHWNREGQVLQTCPARVSQGEAKFDETLMHKCAVYTAKNGGSSNSPKYEPKQFLLYASVVGASALDIGKYWIDLTEILHQNRNLNNISFSLAGKAKGAILNVSFGVSLSDLDASYQFGSSSSVRVHDFLEDSEPSSADDNQLSDLSHVPSHFKSPSIDINAVFPIRGLDQSITSLYENKLEGQDFSFYFEHLGFRESESGTEFGGESSGSQCNDDTEFTVIEQGLEYSDKILQNEKESNSVVEVVEWVEESSSSVDDDDGEKGFLDQEEDIMKLCAGFEDDIAIESVTNEFLSTLSFEQGQTSDPISDPESPRERLLREFEKDAIASGNFLFSHDVDDDYEDDENDRASQLPLRSRRMNAMLENLETEEMIQRWRSNETDFQNSLSGGFGSPVYIWHPEEAPKSSPSILGEGLDLDNVLKTL
jgi:hypothetical protein